MPRTHRLCCDRCFSVFQDHTNETPVNDRVFFEDLRRPQFLRMDAEMSVSVNSSTSRSSIQQIAGWMFAVDGSPTQQEMDDYAASLLDVSSGDAGSFSSATLLQGGFGIIGVDAYRISAARTRIIEGAIVSPLAQVQANRGTTFGRSGIATWSSGNISVFNNEIGFGRISRDGFELSAQRTNGSGSRNQSGTFQALSLFGEPFHLPSYTGPETPCCFRGTRVTEDPPFEPPEEDPGTESEDGGPPSGIDPDPNAAAIQGYSMNDPVRQCRSCGG